MTETTKIVRMQQRRGLKQDLPKPLRPGEIGFATDSRQLYIGADTESDLAQQYNKTGIFEKTSSAQSTTVGFANVQVIKFTVPHKIYDKGDFDGVTTTAVWTPESNVASSSTATEYSRLNRVFRTGDTYFRNILDGNEFTPAAINVVKNGTVLVESNTASISSSEDYFFDQGGDILSSPHTLTFRTPPNGSEEVLISYYGNSTVNHAISNTTIGVTGVDGFNAYAGLTTNTYRQLDSQNIRVSPGTGIGFIGLQFKHIQVATDVKHSPIAFENTGLVLGNLFLSRDDEVVTDCVGTANAISVSIVGAIDSGSYNVAGAYNHVYIEDAVTGDWLNGKVLEVTSYDSANTTIVAALPNNAMSVSKSVSSYGIDGSNIDMVVGSTDDIEVGDVVYFIDGDGTANLDTRTGNVVSVTTSTETVVVDTVGTDANANVNTANLTFVTYKAGANTEIVMTSTYHGMADGANAITTNNTDISVGTVNAETTGNANTFILTTASSITKEYPGLEFTPVVSSGNVSTTRVFGADISSANTAEAAISVVTSLGQWPRLSTIPGSTSAEYKVYVTHTESVVKTPFDFTLHNDSGLTASTLGLTPDTYTRGNATVKADLENWLDLVRNNTGVNLFKEVYVNEEFNDTGHFTTWDLQINSTLGEMDFESREEARDFAAVLNNLYFESVNPDIKGLLNIKSNIEFLTLEALASGTATTSFSAPESVTLSSGLNVVSELSASDLSVYDSFIVEYSMVDELSGNANVYKRIGTIQYTGDSNAEDGVLLDSYTDLQANVTGNVEFTVSVTGSALTVTANNTISPTTDVTMSYIVRRWLT